MKITNEQIEQVAQAMWDSNYSRENSRPPKWDKLGSFNVTLKQEIRAMAKAGIRKWLGITQKKVRMMQCAFGEELADVRVITESEGWSMVRRKGAAPFVRRTSELRPIEHDHPPAGAQR